MIVRGHGAAQRYRTGWMGKGPGEVGSRQQLTVMKRDVYSTRTLMGMPFVPRPMGKAALVMSHECVCAIRSALQNALQDPAHQCSRLCWATQCMSAQATHVPLHCTGQTTPATRRASIISFRHRAPGGVPRWVDGSSIAPPRKLLHKHHLDPASIHVHLRSSVSHRYISAPHLRTTVQRHVASSPIRRESCERPRTRGSGARFGRCWHGR